MIRWFLDNTLEVALAVIRGAALLLPGGALGLYAASIWAGDAGTVWRLVGTGSLLLVVGVGAAAVGFYLYGNEEWRPRRGDAER